MHGRVRQRWRLGCMQVKKSRLPTSRNSPCEILVPCPSRVETLSGPGRRTEMSAAAAIPPRREAMAAMRARVLLMMPTRPRPKAMAGF